jgi:hypothetical protein
MAVDSTWTCSTCGKVNHDNDGKIMRRGCITCGRQRGCNADCYWTCAICGKVNHDNCNETKERCCITCGRLKGVTGYKAVTTPPTSVATYNGEVRMAEPKDSRGHGYAGNQPMFLSNKNNYEANARMSIIDEVKSVLASIRCSSSNNYSAASSPRRN